MRPWLFLSLLIIFSPSLAAEKPVPPTNPQLLQIFFQHINSPLKGESECQMQCREEKEGEDANDPELSCKTLAEYLSMVVLAENSIYHENKTSVGPTIETSCGPDLLDLIFPDDFNGWLCAVHFSGGTKEEPRLSVTSIEMIIKSDLTGIVPGTIKCW